MQLNEEEQMQRYVSESVKEENGEGITAKRESSYRTEMPVLPFRPMPSFSARSLLVKLRPAPALTPFGISNIFQNLRSSSLLAVTTVIPSGLSDECKMRLWCACGISATLVSEG